jgi:tetratricopeptide (TPR) repeat protein
LEIAKGLRQLGAIRRGQGRLAEAEKLMLEQLPIVRELGNQGDLDWSLGELSYLFMAEDKLSKAEEAFREDLMIGRRLCGSDQGKLLSTLLGLTDCLIRERKVVESETYVREAVEIERKLTEDQRAQSAVAGYTASLLERLGDSAEAEVWYRQALLSEAKYPRMTPNQYAQAVISAVTIHFPQQKFHELEISFPEWLLQARARIPPGDPNLADILAQVVTAPLFEQNWVEAENLAQECLTIREKKLSDDWRTYEARGTLGRCLFGQKRYKDAEPLLLSGCEGLRKHAAEIPGDWRPRASADLECLVQLYDTTGRPDLAGEWRMTRQEFDQHAGPTQAAQAH